MGRVSDLALAGVTRVERRFGKRAALRALMPLLDGLEGTVRSEAMVRALGYAAELEDGPLSERLAMRWASDRNGRHADLRRMVLGLLESGAHPAATILAQAEVGRTAGRYDEASARYLLGRALESTSAGRALEAYDAAADAARGSERSAPGQRQPRLLRASEIRAVRQLLTLDRRLEAADRAGALLPLDATVDARDRLAIAVAALGSRGRYRRAAALDVLLDLTAVDELRGRAVGFALLHAEEMGDALSDIETDRTRAIVLAVEEPDAATALDRLVRGARDSSGSMEHVSSTPRAAIGRLASRAVEALRGDRTSDAERDLAALTSTVRAGGRVEGALYTAIAIGWQRAPVAARALLETALVARGEPPPRGYLDLAGRMSADGSDDRWLERILVRAVLRNEPGAAAHLGALLRRHGHDAAENGDPVRAISRLREAKRWLTAQSGKAPRQK